MFLILAPGVIWLSSVPQEQMSTTQAKVEEVAKDTLDFLIQ